MRGFRVFLADGGAMDKAAWERLLSVWAADAVKRAEIEPTAGPFSGLGLPGVTAEGLLAAEARLGCQLPPSYREFLKCTNGLHQPRGYVAARGGNFWSAEEIDWFRMRNRDWIYAYMDSYADSTPDDRYFVYGPEQEPYELRCEYLEHALEISTNGDASVYLLNPKIVGAGGEWEAWFFANWLPGALRYRSFAEMMLAHYDGFRLRGLDGF
jgi:hypothetical protein